MIHIDPTATDTERASVLYRNVLSEGTLAWSSETADGYAANALGPQTYDSWTPSAVPATLSVTLGAPVTCDCAAIIAHTLGSAGATVEVQHFTGGIWVTAQSVTPPDDRDIVMIFGAVSAAQWRIRVIGAVASIGIVMIGPRLLIPGGTQAGYEPLNLALDVELSPSITIRGQYVGAYVKQMGAGTPIALAAQEREWVQTEAVPFIAHYNAGRPFVWMSCPDMLPEDGHYCWRAGNTLSASFGPGAMWADMSMQVSAYVS
ncbi:hypothetical protein [Neotabrizicola sp. VNH66]|uniref:hypothetical protein n=1 Tax=Neotabrizicola sp. VNH66 TaxID=3400918 RepID=UPI003C075C03